MRAFQDRLNGRVKDIPDLISLSSWMHGLNTTLGQSFFETVAQILCDGEKRTFKDKQIYENQEVTITRIINSLKNGDSVPCFLTEDEQIATSKNGRLIKGMEFTADCYYETNEEVVAIEMKSVRPNSGEMKGEKEKMLKAKAELGLLEENKGKRIRYIMAFPFDPTSDNAVDYDKNRFFDYLIEAKNFIDNDEMKIADELWSFLSGVDGTMNDILTIINDIATPEFQNNFNFIQNNTSAKSSENLKLLQKWHLFSEIAIINHKESFTEDREIRKLNLKVFKENGEYNARRLELLH